MLCIRPDASVHSGPVASAQTAQMEIRAVPRAVTFLFDSTWAEGSNLVQAVSVVCCRYFVALVVELEAIARSNDSGT